MQEIHKTRRNFSKKDKTRNFVSCTSRYPINLKGPLTKQTAPSSFAIVSFSNKSRTRFTAGRHRRWGCFQATAIKPDTKLVAGDDLFVPAVRSCFTFPLPRRLKSVLMDDRCPPHCRLTLWTRTGAFYAATDATNRKTAKDRAPAPRASMSSHSLEWKLTEHLTAAKLKCAWDVSHSDVTFERSVRPTRSRAVSGSKHSFVDEIFWFGWRAATVGRRTFLLLKKRIRCSNAVKRMQGRVKVIGTEETHWFINKGN